MECILFCSFFCKAEITNIIKIQKELTHWEMNLTPFGITQTWSTLIFEQHKPKAASHSSRFMFYSGICAAEGMFSWGQTLFFQQSHCLWVQLSKWCWALPAGAGLTGKVSSPLALNVKLYAGNQLLICNQQSNPSALIQGLNESLLTGEAWKTWFIPLPVVACWSEPDLASHPQQNHRQGLGSAAGEEESAFITFIIQDQGLTK